MLSTRTVGELWAEYLEVRSALSRNGLLSEEAERLQHRADQLRDCLLVNYSPLVKYVTGRVSARMIGAVDREDFMSAGMIGLLDAIRTFDPEREVKFETYAISKIRWAMLDEARKEDSLPRRTRSRLREVETARRELTQELYREPTELEIADKTGLDPSEIRDATQQQVRSQTKSFEAQAVDQESSALEAQIADEAAEDPESSVEQDEVRRELVTAMQSLSERERTVVTLYFYENLTLREIGQALGVTEGRISQILKRTLGKLRDFIGTDQQFSGGFV